MAHFGDHHVVKYGSPIALKHQLTGVHLHSHGINYVTGSHQQEITGFAGHDDNDYWIVKGPNGGDRYNAPIGFPVLNGQVVRLEHLLTGKNLHSHAGHQSPDTHQGEVTGFGDHGVGDDNDNWRLEIVGGGPNQPWHLDHKVRFIHVLTNSALHSHAGHFTASRQQEVTGFGGRDDNDLWHLSH